MMGVTPGVALINAGPREIGHPGDMAQALFQIPEGRRKSRRAEHEPRSSCEEGGRD